MTPVTKTPFTFDNVKGPVAMILAGIVLTLIVITAAGWW